MESKLRKSRSNYALINKLETINKAKLTNVK